MENSSQSYLSDFWLCGEGAKFFPRSQDNENSYCDNPLVELLLVMEPKVVSTLGSDPKNCPGHILPDFAKYGSQV